MEESGQTASEFIAGLDNVHHEVRFLLGEIQHKDEESEKIGERIAVAQNALFKPSKKGVFKDEDPDLVAQIQADFERQAKLSKDKVALAAKLQRLLHKHKGRLGATIQKIVKLTGAELPEELTVVAVGEKHHRMPADRIAESLRAAVASPAGVVTSTPVQPPMKKRRLNNVVIPATPVEEKVPISLNLGALRNKAAITQSVIANPSPLRQSTRARRKTQDPEGEGGEGDAEGEDEAEDENLYCYCQKKSYGEMIGCESNDCKYEWFHLSCVGLKSPLPDVWYCSECAANLKLPVGAPGGGTEKRKGRKANR